ncbi:hypothetical protein [Haliangium sp.]|uniref:hypothetical protein n=1 Tax=Haliangium sp. TaxID=2663208 RepID=UPI003D0FE32A
MSNYKDFTSLPPDKEAQFVVYEKTTVEALKKARVIALCVTVGFLITIMAIVFTHDPPKNKMAHDDMGLLKSGPEAKKSQVPAKKPAAAEGEAADKAEGEAATTGEGEAVDKAEGEAADKAEGEGGDEAADDDEGGE